MSARAPPRRVSMSEVSEEVNGLIATMQSPAFALTPFFSSCCYYEEPLLLYDADTEDVPEMYYP